MNSRFSKQPRTPGQFDASQSPTKQSRARRARILGIGVVLPMLLLVSVLATALVLHSAHSSAYASGGQPTPTPTIGTPAPGEPQPQGSLYTATPGSLSRINLKNRKVLWTIQASYPSAPLVMGKTLFFENEDSSNPFLEAANAQTGAQIWSIPKTIGLFSGSGNMLYGSNCDYSDTDVNCYLYGIDAGTGAQVWSYDLHQGSAWFTLHNGVLYGVSYTSYFAVTAATGVQLWQKDLLSYQDQEANIAPVVSGNILSFVSCNTTKQSSGFPGCYLYAFKASTGQELWHMSTTSTLQATPTIMGNVVYAGAGDGTVYALNEQTGTQLWSANAGGPIEQLLSHTGTVYVETLDAGDSHVEAFDAATHAPIWGQISSIAQSTIPLALHSPLSGGPAVYPFELVHGLIYVKEGEDTVAAINATDGSEVTRYIAPGSPLYGYTVVA